MIGEAHAVCHARLEEVACTPTLSGGGHSVVEALLSSATVPSTDRHQEKTPGNVAREISRRAAAKAAVTAGSLAMPPGPLGWLTIAPELLAVWTIQAQMVSDLAGVYGKTATC